MSYTFYDFKVSHFCEKARWALDYKGVDYKTKSLVPGYHRIWTTLLGLPEATVPFLTTHTGPVQGSSPIIDHLDKNIREYTLSDPGELSVVEFRTIEAWLDENIGVSMRSIWYYNTINSGGSGRIAEFFDLGMPPVTKAMTRLMAPIYPLALLDMYQLTDAEYVRCCNAFKDAVKELAKKYEVSPYLNQKCFSRLDLTAASLLANMEPPAEHPMHDYLGPFEYPAPFTEFVRPWLTNPAWLRAKEIYRDYRLPVRRETT